MYFPFLHAKCRLSHFVINHCSLLFIGERALKRVTLSTFDEAVYGATKMASV